MSKCIKKGNFPWFAEGELGWRMWLGQRVRAQAGVEAALLPAEVVSLNNIKAGSISTWHRHLTKSGATAH